MITLSDATLSVLQRSHRRYVAVESWLGGELLAADIPIADASEEADRGLRVPERVTFAVPRRDRGESWSPVADDHPLASNGQTLRVKLGVGLANGAVEWFQRGTFLVQEADTRGDTVTVTALGLLALVDEARLASPFQPTGTLVSTLRGLIEPALTVDVTASPTDRSVPSDVNYDEDRLGAVLELLDAWAATAAVDPFGILRVVPAVQSTTALLSLTDSPGGTVITASGGSTREGACNVVVARGTATDGGQVQGVAYDTSTGPTRYGGNFNPLPVPVFFQSPLLRTADQCTAAANSILARRLRSVAREFQVEMVPHPALQVGDVVSITTDIYTDLVCSVEALRLPYLPSGGAMSLTLRALPV